MFIETHYKGIRINRFEVEDNIDLKALQMYAVIRSKMSCESVKDYEPNNEITSPVQSIIKKKRPTIKKQPLVKDTVVYIPEEIVREKGRYSNSRPYDELYEF